MKDVAATFHSTGEGIRAGEIPFHQFCRNIRNIAPVTALAHHESQRVSAFKQRAGNGRPDKTCRAGDERMGGHIKCAPIRGMRNGRV